MGTAPKWLNGYLNWITELGEGVSYRENWREALLPIEKIVAILYLRIRGILDLDPRLTVLAFLWLHDNASEGDSTRDRRAIAVVNGDYHSLSQSGITTRFLFSSA